MQGLQIDMHRQDDIAVLQLSGSADMNETRQLEKQIHALYEQGEKRLVIDLAEVTFISSSGLSALIQSQKLWEEMGGKLRMVRPPESVMKVFRTTQLDEFFSLHEDKAEAVASAKG